MSVYNRILVCSSQIFNGFEVKIDIRYYSNLEELINTFKNELLKILKEYKFNVLEEKFNKSNFHIHTHSFDEILLKNEIIYVCDNC